MSELEQGRFREFCDVVEGGSTEELAHHLWPGSDHDPSTTLAPVAERHFNSEATQLAWLEEVKSNVEAYRRFYDRLEDPISKLTLASIFRYRFTWVGDHLTQTQPGPKYFDWSLIERLDNAVYVDAGAFDGGSVGNFMDAYGEDYSSIYAFEPFPNSFAALEARYGHHRDMNLIRKGLWDAAVDLGYAGKNQSVTVLPVTEMTVEPEGVIETTTLDEHLQELPSIIKMDIEGSELRAIRGAARVIESGMPQLAICAYHLIDDLRTLPEAILAISDNYDLSLRNYKTRGSAEIVLYARAQRVAA